MVFARIGHGSCYHHWNEIFAGVIGGAACNNISADRSKIFANNQKIVVLDKFFSCLQTLDLATLMLLHTAPPTQSVF